MWSEASEAPSRQASHAHVASAKDCAMVLTSADAVGTKRKDVPGQTGEEVDALGLQLLGLPSPQEPSVKPQNKDDSTRLWRQDCTLKVNS